MRVFASTMREKRYSRFAAFPIGEGGPHSDARVLSLMAHFRRSPSLFFIPLVPYPARSARRYPHILCLTANEKDFSLSLEMTIWGKRHSRIVSLPHWGRGTAPAVDRVLSYIVDLRRSPSLSFIPLVPYPARSARHLPLEGKALSVDIVFLHTCVYSF